MAAISGIVAGFGLLAFIVAVASGSVSIATGIRGMSVAVTALLGLAVLREQVTPFNLLGLLLAIVAIWLLSAHLSISG